MSTEPSAPENFRVNRITATTARLLWCMPSVTNGIILNYTLIYSNTSHTINMVHDNDTFFQTIKYLNENTHYRFTIYANTSAGKGNTTIREERTKESRK